MDWLTGYCAYIQRNEEAQLTWVTGYCAYTQRNEEAQLTWVTGYIARTFVLFPEGEELAVLSYRLSTSPYLNYSPKVHFFSERLSRDPT